MFDINPEAAVSRESLKNAWSNQIAVMEELLGRVTESGRSMDEKTAFTTAYNNLRSADPDLIEAVLLSKLIVAAERAVAELGVDSTEDHLAAGSL